jgi:hypothetical protein
VSAVWFLHEEFFLEYLLFPGKGWKQNFLMEPSSIAVVSDSGFVTSELFLLWL